MRQYDLSSEEGVLLMCVAEALLRIPDKTTTDKLIRDKLGDANWRKHLGRSESLLVNASTWGLMLTGQLVNLADATRADFAGRLRRLVARVGEPTIRVAVRQAMRIMGHQFVMGRTIGEALDRAGKRRQRALPLFLRHARRSRRSPRAGRRALQAGLPRCHRRAGRARPVSPAMPTHPRSR